MIHEGVKTCPRCDLRLKSWAELDEEQEMIAERLEKSAEYSLEERKKHRYCTRCWFEFVDIGPQIV